MKTRNLTPEDVLAYIEDNRGMRYQISQLARAFRVPAGEMSPIAKGLAAVGLVLEIKEGNHLRFYLRTPEEEAAQNRVPYRPEFKPLTGYTAENERHAAACVAGR